jgi:hypothetical protein
MAPELTKQQEAARRRFRAFVDEQVVPYADQQDREERTRPQILQKIATAGFLAPTVPKEQGGKGMDMLTFGLLCEEMGRGSASLLSLLTVQNMVARAILKWGSAEQRKRWLPALSAGDAISGFALTEPTAGSDAKAVKAAADLRGGDYVLNGEKQWISWGQVAALFLVIAQCEGRPSAFLVERDREGLSIHPVQGMLGFRSAMLAALRMNRCSVPANRLLGRIGFGLSHVAGTALDAGRYAVAWGCVGLAQACLDSCIAHTLQREQGGCALREHQLIQGMIADMFTATAAARMLCHRAGRLKNAGSPESVPETCVAKYFASKAAYKAAADAVQIHGAIGCSPHSPVQRYLRDAKIMEIIEGTSQIQQILIANYAYRTVGA